MKLTPTTLKADIIDIINEFEGYPVTEQLLAQLRERLISKFRPLLENPVIPIQYEDENIGFLHLFFSILLTQTDRLSVFDLNTKTYKIVTQQEVRSYSLELSCFNIYTTPFQICLTR